MQMFIEYHGEDILNAVEEDLFITSTNTNGVKQPKPKDAWNDDGKKKV